MAKKKKNFKDVTGIKFADLIMPLVLGGVGSYSQSAGRGVNLGLQAFRTLQAGREYQDEKDLSKGMVENFENTAQQYVDERNTIQQGITREDPTMTSAKGYYKEEGVIAPDPKWKAGDEEMVAGGISDEAREPSFLQHVNELGGDRLDPTLGIAAMSDAGAEKNAMDVINKAQGLTGDDAQVAPQFESMRMQQQEMIPQEAMDFTQRILERKIENQDSARRLGFIDKQIRFYEQMAALGAVNPSSAGYLAGMNELQRMGDDAQTQFLWDTHKSQAIGRADKHKISMIEMLKKHDLNKAEIAQRAETQKYVPMNLGDGVLVVFNKETKKFTRENFSEVGSEDLRTLPFEKKQKAYLAASAEWEKLKKGVENGHIAPDSESIVNAQALMNLWWGAMTPEDEATAVSLGQPLPTPSPRIGGGLAQADDAAVRAAQEAINF